MVAQRALKADLRQLLLQTTLALTLLSSSYVRVEPAPTDTLALLLIGLWVILPGPRSSVSVPLVVLSLATALLSLIPFLLPNWRGDVEFGLQFGAVTLYLTVFCLVVAQLCAVYGKTILRWILLAFLGASLISLIPSLLAYLGLLEIAGVIHTGGQLKGFFKDPNVFGPILVIAFGFALYLAVEARGYVRIWWVLLALLELAGIFLNFSRGAWLNLAVVLVVLAATRFVPLRHQLALYLTGLLLVVAALPVVAPTRLGVSLANEIGLSSWGEGQVGLNEDLRFSNQAAAFQIAQNTLLGFGAGQSQVVLPLSTHNLYLQVLLEQGWLGLLLFMGCLALTLTRLLAKLRITGQARAFYAMLMALLLGVLVNSLVIDSLHWRYFWVLLALAWGDYE